MKNLSQSTWKMWFITSVTVFLAMFFIGALPGSVVFFPLFWWMFGPVILNLVACIYVGLNSQSHEE